MTFRDEWMAILRQTGTEVLNIKMSTKRYPHVKHKNCNKVWRRDSDKCREVHKGSEVPGPSSEGKEMKTDRPPPGLKGKAIGIWYRDRQKLKKTFPSYGMEIILKSQTREGIENIISSVNLSVGNSANYLENYSQIQSGEFRDKFLQKISSTFEEKLDKAVVSKVEQNYDSDNLLFHKLKNMMGNAHYKEMYEFRKTLPTFSAKEKIVSAIEDNSVVVISGETGCGKTTQIVQYILDDFIKKKKGSLCNIVCTQPRRISAISVAERVAAERIESLGESIGYQIRLEKKLPTRSCGSIVFATTGIVVQWLQSNPALNGVSHLIVDEVHERSIMSDFLIALVKYIITKRTDLKVILMSATLNAEKFSEYFDGAPYIHVPGRAYPVEEIYLEDILGLVNFRFPFTEKWKIKKDAIFHNYILPYIRNLEKGGLYPKFVTEELKRPESEVLSVDLMEAVIKHICLKECEGAILVFVPGLSDIKALHNQIMKNRYFSSGQFLIIPLHSLMPSTKQRQVFEKPPKGVRKIVIATSIAETSITIDDVVFVIDTGKIKMKNFDQECNVSTLDPEWESLANATQRKGRAGRTRSGKCYKLFTKAREQIFEPFSIPEMQRSRLEEVVLQAKMLQLGHVGPFLEKVLDSPDSKAVNLSLQMLRTLNALDTQERLTPLGYHLAGLPMDPQTGKLILMSAIFSCVDPIFSIAASLSFKDPFIIPMNKEKEVDRVKEGFASKYKSDHYILYEAIRKWEEAETCGSGSSFAWENYLSVHTLRLLRDMKNQFGSYLFDMKYLSSPDPKNPANNVNSENIDLIKAIVCAGLYPNVAMIKKTTRSKHTGKTRITLKTADHIRVEPHPSSYCGKVDKFEFPLFIYHKMLKSSAIYLHDLTMIHPMPLLFFGERLDITEEKNGCGIRVDDMIKFKFYKKNALLVKKLKKYLEEILEDLISNPNVINWREENDKTLILNAILILLTTQEYEFRMEAQDETD